MLYMKLVGSIEGICKSFKMLNVRCKMFLIGLLLVVSVNLFSQTKNKLEFDTATTSIIEFNKKDNHQSIYIDSNNFSTILSQKDLKTIDSVLRIVMIEKKLGDISLLDRKVDLIILDSLWKAMKLFKNKEDIIYKRTDSLSKSLFYQEHYIKQLIPFSNLKKQRFVFVNVTYCHSIICGERWKKELSIYADGGNCCFRFKINLATKQYFDFEVNEVGG